MADLIESRAAAIATDSDGHTSLKEFWKPLIWPAIIGGMVIAMGIQIILTLFGVGLGAAVTNPASGGADAREMGIGAVIWLILSGIISFGVGGYIAGSMSGVLRTGGGAIHGILAWALAAVLGATLTALAGSATMGGAASGAGAAMSNIDVTGPIAGLTDSNAGGLIAPDQARSEGEGSTQAGAAARAADSPEARVAAEEAAEAVAQVSMWTGVAFLLSMLSAAAGGVIGRKGHVDRSHSKGDVSQGYSTGRPVIA